MRPILREWQTRGGISALACLLAVLLLQLPTDAQAASRLGGFEPISAASPAPPGGAVRGDAGCASTSSNGRFVVFWSTDDYISSGSDPSTANLFIRDRLAAATTLVLRKNPLDAQGNRLGEADEVEFGNCPAVSDDGRYVLFVTQAKLTPTDRFLCEDVYLYDRATGAARLLNSSSTDGGLYPALSADGRYAIYVDGILGLVRHDLAGGGVQQVPSYINWGQASGRGPVAISASGRFIAYQSESSLGPNAAPLLVYLADMATGSVVIASRSDGPEGPPFEIATEPSISNDGRWVGFSALLPERGSGTGRYSGTFVRDLATGRTSFLSLPSRAPQLSGDGRYVAFISAASRLSRYDGPGDDLFVRDLQTGETALVTKRRRANRGPSSVGFPEITDAGDQILFTSDEPSLSNGSKQAHVNVFARALRASGSLDVEAPEVGVAGRYRARRKAIVLRLRCNENCRVKGKVTFRSRVLGRSLVRAIRVPRLRPGKVRVLRVTVPKPLRKVSRMRSAKYSYAKAIVRVQARDRSGNREGAVQRIFLPPRLR